jgi:hypothetical protein
MYREVPLAALPFLELLLDIQGCNSYPGTVVPARFSSWVTKRSTTGWVQDWPAGQTRRRVVDCWDAVAMPGAAPPTPCQNLTNDVVGLGSEAPFGPEGNAMLDSPSALTEETVNLWVKSFQGEVLGEAYFSRMTTMATDDGEKGKLETLTALERCTKELLAPCLERLGISTVPDRAGLDLAAALAAEYDYQGMVSSIPVATAEYLGYYGRLRKLVDEQDADSLNLLIAHELALELFARRETSGDTETSLEPIRVLPHFHL